MQYDFSEAQAGKSYCDAKIAHLRQKMRRYVAGGNDIKTPTDMKTAIDSAGGVAGCQAAVVAIDSTKQQLSSHKWKDVNQVTDIDIKGNSMTAYRAFGIGTGKAIDVTQMASSRQDCSGLVIICAFKKPQREEGVISKPNPNTDPTQCFQCSEDGCVQSFSTFEAYENHMYFEKHTYEMDHGLSSYDRIKLRWAQKCNLSEEDKESIVLPTTSFDEDHHSSFQGWALKKERKQVRFKQHVRDFLKSVFMVGENSGKKANPIEVAAQMRTMTDENGRVFSAQDCLKPSQIISYFSRLSALSKKDSSKKEDRTLATEEDEYLNHVLQEIEMQEIKDSLNI